MNEDQFQEKNPLSQISFVDRISKKQGITPEEFLEKGKAKERPDSKNQKAIPDRKKIQDESECLDQELAFAPRITSDCSMLINREKGLKSWNRTNGKASLSFTALNKKYDLPYGKDRILTYWLKTKTKRSKSDLVPFEGVSATLKEMQLEVNKRNIDWLKDAILRFYHTFVDYSFGTPLEGGETVGRGTIISHLNGIDFTKKGKHQSGTIRVCKDFFDTSGIPIDLNVISELGRCYGAYDLYVIIRRHLFDKKDGKDIFIKLEHLANQLGFPEDMQPKRMKEGVERLIKALVNVKTDPIPIPYFNASNTFVIPNEPMRPIWNKETQKRLREQFDRA